MLSIFVGVLGEGYTQAYERRERMFFHHRAKIVSAHTARARGWQTLSRKTPFGVKVLPEDIGSNSKDYVWYCRRKAAEDVTSAQASGPSNEKRHEKRGRGADTSLSKKEVAQIVQESLKQELSSFK